jgi:hypothetical protein
MRTACSARYGMRLSDRTRCGHWLLACGWRHPLHACVCACLNGRMHWFHITSSAQSTIFLLSQNKRCSEPATCGGQQCARLHGSMTSSSACGTGGCRDVTQHSWRRRWLHSVTMQANLVEQACAAGARAHPHKVKHTHTHTHTHAQHHTCSSHERLKARTGAGIQGWLHGGGVVCTALNASRKKSCVATSVWMAHTQTPPPHTSTHEVQRRGHI